MAGLESGTGIPVVTPGDEHTFVLDEEALSSLLLREDIKERAAVVVSVAGAFRKGKSFLLDFFLRYLHNKYVLGDSSDDWLGAPDEPLKGFHWRGGSERDTTGLLLWSQPFKATLANGEKVVIFLVDTQGAFDSESTVKDCATIFALSTMLSSVQIYNLSQNIEEDDLQHLQLFTEYGRLATQSSRGKPFQQLHIAVRDWSYPYEYHYGTDGGQRLLDKRLEVQNGQHPELQALRVHVRSCFERCACCLLPHPGLKVATSPHFDGRRSDISKEFLDILCAWVPSLLSPQALVPKKIDGQKVKAKDLLIYFKSYMHVFNGTELPEPKSILEATAEANNLSAVAEAREVYEGLMDEVCGGTRPYLDPRRLEDEHQRSRDKALHAFTSKKKMGGDEMEKGYLDQLIKELEENFIQLRAHNDAKNMLKMARTPLVFAFVAALAYLFAALARACALQSLLAICQAVAGAAVMLLLVWCYSRVTGNMREIGIQLDEVADRIQDFAMYQIWNPYGSRPTEHQKQS